MRRNGRRCGPLTPRYRKMRTELTRPKALDHPENLVSLGAAGLECFLLPTLYFSFLFPAVWVLFAKPPYGSGKADGPLFLGC
jgi:hypothetical protein